MTRRLPLALACTLTGLALVPAALAREPSIGVVAFRNLGIYSVYRGRPGAFHTRTLTFVFVHRRVDSVQVSEVFVH